MSEQSPYSIPKANIKSNLNEKTYYPTFFSLKGRLGRLRFVAYSFSSFLVLLIFLFIVMGLYFNYWNNNINYSEQIFTEIVLFTFYLFLLTGVVIFSVRRLNDINLSGVFSIIYLATSVAIYFDVLANLSLTLSLLLSIFLLLKTGNPKVNQYGPVASENTLSIKILGLILPTTIIVVITLNIAFYTLAFD